MNIIRQRVDLEVIYLGLSCFRAGLGPLKKQQKTILQEINFRAPAGQITAILVGTLWSSFCSTQALLGTLGGWKILVTPAARRSILERRSLVIFSLYGVNNVQRYTTDVPNRVNDCLCRTG